VNGVATDLAFKTYPIVLGQWYKVRLAMDGPALSVYVNDTLQLSATDTQYKAGVIGVGGFNSTGLFDDVVVRNLGGGSATSCVPTGTQVCAVSFSFNPANLTVPVGTTVTWKNGDPNHVLPTS
jgi:hypothetical protein